MAPRKSRNRASQQQKEQRLHMVDTLLDQGVPRVTIVQVLEKQYGIRTRQASRYVSDAINARNASVANTSVDKRLIAIEKKYEYLYRLEIQNKDTKAAAKILEKLTQLIINQDKLGGSHAISSPSFPTADGPDFKDGLKALLDSFDGPKKSKKPKR